ncbi:MAG: methyltransferase [Candidatus Zixiibacteriota bacterium]
MRMKMYLLSLLAFFVVIAIVVFSGDLAINQFLLSPTVRWAGAAILGIGYILRVLAWIVTKTYDIRDNPEEGHPDGKGIYKLMRHPKLWGAFIMYIGFSIAVSSLVGVILTIIIILPITLYRIKLYNEYTNYSSSSTRASMA